MSDLSDKIQMMRDQQLNRSIRAVAVIGLITLLSSLSRALVIGWHPVMGLHIALYLIMLGVLFSKKWLSMQFRAAAIISSCFLVGLGALISWGFIAFGPIALFCSCILATLFFGYRTGIQTSLLCIASMIVVGICAYAGILTFEFNTKTYLNSPITWLNGILALALPVGVIVSALGTLVRQVECLVRSLQNQNEELLNKNLLLNNEITERKKSEEERMLLERKLQMAKRMESLGHLAGGVAHDLNNTLGSVVGYPDLLLEELPPHSPLRDTVETIKKSGLKAAAIVQDLLTLARRGITATSIVPINSVISEYCSSPEFKQLRAYHPGVEVDLKLDMKPLNVRGSFFHLSKVIMNLVSNAAEAMPDGGRIIISTEQGTLAESAETEAEIRAGEYAVLRVVDTGTGIPQEDLDRIFEPFYTKKTMGRSGTGLGMSVVWGTVKDHNGYIQVDSVEGKGTTFTVYLPLSHETLIPKESSLKSKMVPGRGETVLVVDDVVEQRDIASRVLRKIGYSVHAVGSGEDAILYLKNASADLLILDMHMDPGMDGLETYRQVLEIHPRQKALIATGYADPSRIKAAQSLGITGFLRKPYLFNEFAHAVRTELDRQPSLKIEPSPGI